MHIELIATDGTTQKRILWVDVTSNSVCTGMCFQNGDIHTTYHFDGNVFTHMLGKKPEKLFTTSPLNDFRGHHQLVCMAFSSDLAKMHNTPLYRLKKVDAMVSVDVRAYKKGIGCNVVMMERNRYDELGDLGKGLPEIQITEVHNFLTCNPWISLVLYGGVNKNSAV